jgi:gliding motility-associated-like protein
MKQVKSLKKLALFFILFLAVSFGVKAQHGNPINMNYIFSSDSLVGFDESAAQQGAFSIGAYGEEFKVYMHVQKRYFIDAKYNLIKPIKEVQYLTPYRPSNEKGPGYPNVLVANCQNEDYEEGSLTFPTSPATITVSTPNAVNGWTINGGSNSSWSTYGNCTNTAVGITGNPSAVVLLNPGAAGHTDAVIGAGYKIWSVFGNTTTTYPAATTANGFQCYGDWFIKLNNQTPGASVQKMRKTINVTPANALFQFAFMTVLQTGHCCCDNGSFRLTVYTSPSCVGVGSPTTCPSFTAASPAATGCTPSGSCVSTGNSTTYFNASLGGWAYNKWKVNTLDLTSFIGGCVTIEVLAMDCPWSGHTGYVYFDAQCSPMDIGGNTNTYPAGTPSISLPTCGAGSTATITAPPVTGGYTWTTPGPYTVSTSPGLLPNQQIYTSITGNHTLTMNPPGSCSPIIRVINVIIAPAPNLAITSNTMYSCTQNTLNGVTLQMTSGTATNNLSTPQYSVTFQPSAPTATPGVTSNTGVYTGLAVGVNTITIVDSVGCIATQTINVTPAPEIPSLTINASQLVVGCAPPTVTIGVVNTNTNLTNMTYTWSSITTTGTPVTSNNSIINVGAPSGSNTLIVTGSDPLSGCVATTSCVLTASTSAPSFTITPVLTQSLGCSQPCKQFTATTTSTTNIFGTWYDAAGVPLVGPSGGTVVLCAGTPGTYAMTFTNMVTGCTTTQTVAVTSNSTIPTLTVTSVLGGFQINCTKPCLPLNINSSVIVGPTTYTWTNLTTSVSTFPPTGGYTVCGTTGANNPGQYVASVTDGFGCTVSQTITISIDTLKPAPTSTATLSSLAPDSYTINCFTPSVVVTGITNPMYPASSYSWTVPPNLIQSNQTATVSMVNVTATMPSSTNYTVLAMNPANGCVGRKLVRFYKDITVPPYTVVYTPTAITCANPCVAFSPNNTVPSNTTPITYTFTSPPPTSTATTLGALMCIPGPYTMTYQNAINGCTNVATTTVQLNVTPPATFALAPITIACGSPTAQLVAGHTGSTASAGTYSYTWDGPQLAGMSCPGGVACYSTSTNMAGDYNVFILNTINGCSATNSVTVNSGVISASLTANPSSGYAPLTVGFDNTTVLQNTTTGTVTTTWNYGNGISMTYTGSSSSYSLTGPPDGSSIYQSAGSYTVYMIVSQSTGTASCVGTASTVIKVELPSKLEVPNVFTPNADGVNDVFMLQTTNLTEITCTIFDRWGVKMYDVIAEKGNIEWDGKNFGKKDVPAGTYFYILKAKGKDLKDYEQKGTISLYR